MRWIYVLLTFFFFCNNATAQNFEDEIDSLFMFVDNYELTRKGLDSVDQIIDQIEKISIEENYLEGAFYAHLVFVQLYSDFPDNLIAGHYDKLDYIVSRYGDQLPDSSMISYYLTKGYRAGAAGNHMTELQYYLAADERYSDDMSIYFKRIINDHLANYYLQVGLNQKALNILEENLKTYDNWLEDPFAYLLNLYNIGYVQNKLKNYKESVNLVRKSIDGGLGEWIDLKPHYITLADSYIHLNKIDSARKYINLALPGDREYSIDQVNFLETCGDFYLKQNYCDSALYCYGQALPIADSLHFMGGIMKINEQMIRAYAVQAKADDILIYLDQFIAIRDSVYQRSSRKLEQEYQIKYDTSKKQARIQELKSQAKIDRYLLITLFCILAFLVLIFVMIRIKLRSKQMQLKQEVQIRHFEKMQVEQELRNKERELANNIDMLDHKNQIISDLKKSIRQKNDQTSILETFEQSYISDVEWQKIIHHFNAIHKDLLQEIQRTSGPLSLNEVRLVVLLKLSYSNAAIASILNISVDGVKKAKQRLKKKIGAENFLF